MNIMISFTCDHCLATLSVEASKVGSQAICPHCHRATAVPTMADPADPFAVIRTAEDLRWDLVREAKRKTRADKSPAVANVIVWLVAFLIGTVGLYYLQWGH